MVEIFSEMSTLELVRVVERIKTPATFLVDTVFPQIEQITSDILPIEYNKQHRRIAPYIVDGAKGINIKREKTKAALYQCPLMGIRRVMGLNDINRRALGETPIISSKTPQERAQELAARDLVDLERIWTNSKTAQAAELLQTGKISVRAFADAGEEPQVDIIDFGWDGLIETDWTQNTADIYNDLREASYQIQENSGLIPTLLICGKNVEAYMSKNKEFREFLLSANANATNFINFQPKFTSPQIRTLGFIPALGLEIASYAETYWDGKTAVPFIAPDNCVMCCPGRGRQIYGSVSILQDKQWVTYAAQAVPVYHANEDNQQSSLTLYSRFLLIPEDISDFVCLKVKA